jgi:predicted amidohydrolase YtcJ
MALAGPKTKVVDLKGRRVLPGSSTTISTSFAAASTSTWSCAGTACAASPMRWVCLKRQVAVTPPPQWVRVVGGFTEHQFAKSACDDRRAQRRRARDAVFLLQSLRSARSSTPPRCAPSGYTRDTPNPPGGESCVARTARRPGCCSPSRTTALLYATLARGPKLPFDYQLNSTRHFMRELNRLGVTGAIDAGGGFQNYPEDYAVIQKLAARGQSRSLAYNLVHQKPKGEKGLPEWTASKYSRQRLLPPQRAARCWCSPAADFEDFREPRPVMPPEMEGSWRGCAHSRPERWPRRLTRPTTRDDFRVA